MMDTDIEALLALLDDEHALAWWLYGNGFKGTSAVRAIASYDHNTKTNFVRRENCVLDRDGAAALAFRLRDEAVAVNPNAWLSGRTIVEYKIVGPHIAGWWWENHAGPEHFIVAALIAQKMKEQGVSQ